MYFLYCIWILIFYKIYFILCDHKKTLPILLIPGLASTQLHSWKKENCINSIYRDINIGDRIWLDTTRLVADKRCWMKCMGLDPITQNDISCRLRPAEGLAGIAELDPGYVTGPMSTIWRTLIEELVNEFDFGPDTLLVASYDWRLPPSYLQKRDNYYYHLMKKIEDAVYKNNKEKMYSGIIVIAHSMGNNIFRYFLEWLKINKKNKNEWEKWIDDHIYGYFALGSPLLGSGEALECLITGKSTGLPLSLADIRELQSSFGSTTWLLPFSSRKDNETFVTVKYIDNIKNYTLNDISNGKMFRDMLKYDLIMNNTEKIREKFYENDSIVNPLTPWSRPPIKRIFSVYGTGLPARDGYTYSQSTKNDGKWDLEDVRLEKPISSVCNKTGDQTVSYYSLSWAHTWLGEEGDHVNITCIPQNVYFSKDDINIWRAKRKISDHHAEYKDPISINDINISNISSCDKNNNKNHSYENINKKKKTFLEEIWASKELKITFFEHEKHEINNSKIQTSVWEIDGASHRDMLGSQPFLRELIKELKTLFNGNIFSDKSSRPPHKDDSCHWNYLSAQCEYPDHCEYSYRFGDVILDHSCRMKKLKIHEKIDIILSENNIKYLNNIIKENTMIQNEKLIKEVIIEEKICVKLTFYEILKLEEKKNNNPLCL